MLLLIRNSVQPSFQFFNFDVGVTNTIGAPVFDSLDLANDAIDHYINAAESLTTNALAGTLSGINYDSAGYALVSFATTCNDQLTYSGTIPLSNSTDFSAQGSYKICVELVKAGFDSDYGASSIIIYDTASPSFSSAPLTNEAVDGTISVADQALDNGLVLIGGSGYDEVGYKIVDPATTGTLLSYTIRREQLVRQI